MKKKADKQRYMEEERLKEKGSYSIKIKIQYCTKSVHIHNITYMTPEQGEKLPIFSN